MSSPNPSTNSNYHVNKQHLKEKWLDKYVQEMNDHFERKEKEVNLNFI